MTIDPTLDGFGEYESTTLEITLADGLPPSVHAATLLHEILHAVEDAAGLRLGERGVRAIEAGVVGWLRHDPRGARAWLDGLLDGADGRGMGSGG